MHASPRQGVPQIGQHPLVILAFLTCAPCSQAYKGANKKELIALTSLTAATKYSGANKTPSQAAKFLAEKEAKEKEAKEKDAADKAAAAAAKEKAAKEKAERAAREATNPRPTNKLQTPVSKKRKQASGAQSLASPSRKSVMAHVACHDGRWF